MERIGADVLNAHHGWHGQAPAWRGAGMGEMWHRATLISIHRDERGTHSGELWSVSHQGALCSWLGGFATLQVATFLRPPCRGRDSQDDSLLTETSRGRAPAQVHRGSLALTWGLWKGRHAGNRPPNTAGSLAETHWLSSGQVGSGDENSKSNLTVYVCACVNVRASA